MERRITCLDIDCTSIDPDQVTVIEGELSNPIHHRLVHHLVELSLPLLALIDLVIDSHDFSSEKVRRYSGEIDHVNPIFDPALPAPIQADPFKST